MQGIAAVTWNSLYTELLSFVYARVRDRVIAQDIVQDVFIKVHTRSHQVKEADKISGWIYQITRNAVADHFRNHSRNIHPANVDWDGDAHEFNDCVAHCLKILMTTLPEKYRIPLELTEIENLSQHEVAKRLNLTHSGARSRVQRARKLLKDKLEKLYRIKTDAYGNVIICENRDEQCCSGPC